MSVKFSSSVEVIKTVSVPCIVIVEFGKLLDNTFAVTAAITPLSKAATAADGTTTFT